MSLLKKIKQKIRLKWKIKKHKKLIQNALVENDIQVDDADLAKIKLKITGKNNVIKIGKMKSCVGNLSIQISGDNNMVFIHEGLSIGVSLNINLGQIHPNFGKIQNIICEIGKNCSFESCQIITFNSHSKIIIGERCMVSYNVEIYHTDGHPIMEYASDKIINHVEELKIGNHVWLGKNVTILKNTQIADDCIVGWGAVVSGKFQQENCILAGNPAHVVKKSITWDANGSKGYIQNEI